MRANSRSFSFIFSIWIEGRRSPHFSQIIPPFLLHFPAAGSAAATANSMIYISSIPMKMQIFGAFLNVGNEWEDMNEKNDFIEIGNTRTRTRESSVAFSAAQWESSRAMSGGWLAERIWKDERWNLRRISPTSLKMNSDKMRIYRKIGVGQVYKNGRALPVHEVQFVA